MADKGVLILPSFYEAMKPLPAEEQLQIFHAICEFGIYGNEPEPDTLSLFADSFFKLVRPVLESANKRYEANCANGKKGGRKKKTQMKPNENPSETQLKPNSNQDKEKDKEKDSEKDSEKNNDSDMDFVPGCTPKQQHEKNSNSTNFNLTSTTPTKAVDNIDISPAPAKPKRAKFVPPALEEVEAYCSEQGLHIDAARFVDYYSANGWKVGRNKMSDWRATARNWARNPQSDRNRQQPLKGTKAEELDDFYKMVGNWANGEMEDEV